MPDSFNRSQGCSNCKKEEREKKRRREREKEREKIMGSWTKTRSFRKKNKCNIYLSVTWVNKLDKRSLTLSGNQESRFMELFRKMCQPLPRLLGSKFQSLKEWLIWYEDMFKKCVTLNRNACTNISEFTNLGFQRSQSVSLMNVKCLL